MSNKSNSKTFILVLSVENKDREEEYMASEGEEFEAGDLDYEVAEFLIENLEDFINTLSLTTKEIDLFNQEVIKLKEENEERKKRTNTYGSNEADFIIAGEMISNFEKIINKTLNFELMSK